MQGFFLHILLPTHDKLQPKNEQHPLSLPHSKRTSFRYKQ